MEIEQVIQNILLAGMPGAKVDIERDTDSGKVGGHVVWDGFAGSKSLSRQNRIFGLLRRQITPAQAQNISFIFTYTTDEYADLLVA